MEEELFFKIHKYATGSAYPSGSRVDFGENPLRVRTEPKSTAAKHAKEGRSRMENRGKEIEINKNNKQL